MTTVQKIARREVSLLPAVIFSNANRGQRSGVRAPDGRVGVPAHGGLASAIRLVSYRPVAPNVVPPGTHGIHTLLGRADREDTPHHPCGRDTTTAQSGARSSRQPRRRLLRATSSR